MFSQFATVLAADSPPEPPPITKKSKLNQFYIKFLYKIPDQNYIKRQGYLGNLTQCNIIEMGQQNQKNELISPISFKTYQEYLKGDQNSGVPPFYENQIKYLQGIFRQLDVKDIKTIQVNQLKNFFILRQHPLIQRIIYIFQQETNKMKVKRIGFQHLLTLLSVFHIFTQIQVKYRFLFKLYDWDGDLKLNANDLTKTFQIIFRGPYYNREAYHQMSISSISKYGKDGFIAFEQFRKAIPQNQVQQIMTLKFIDIN